MRLEVGAAVLALEGRRIPAGLANAVCTHQHVLADLLAPAVEAPDRAAWFDFCAGTGGLNGQLACLSQVGWLWQSLGFVRLGCLIDTVDRHQAEHEDLPIVAFPVWSASPGVAGARKLPDVPLAFALAQ
ncbi:hypothetical protein D3C78_1264670 [compost metagenome]